MSFKIENTLSSIPIYNAENIQGTRVNSKISNTLTNGDIMVWNESKGEWEAGKDFNVITGTFEIIISYNDVQRSTDTGTYTIIGKECTLNIPEYTLTLGESDDGVFTLTIPKFLKLSSWKFFPIIVFNTGMPGQDYDIGSVENSEEDDILTIYAGLSTNNNFSSNPCGYLSFNITYLLN